ncbi:MAG TPA: type II toxin-antitoxin system VapC family toxin [Kiritimatiellia bacterium]|nr:type II toxin-antitoxin system VapC family toxin [Kiritimatiellia bacterium]
MIYLDTSALIKLYLREEGSEDVHRLVTSQDHPLPVWEIQEVELVNALRLKVFRRELSKADLERQRALFFKRLDSGQYFYPAIRRSDLMKNFHEVGEWTPIIGCRTLDLMHVACAVHLQADLFVTFDQRQRSLAERTGLRCRW